MVLRTRYKNNYRGRLGMISSFLRRVNLRCGWDWNQRFSAKLLVTRHSVRLKNAFGEWIYSRGLMASCIFPEVIHQPQGLHEVKLLEVAAYYRCGIQAKPLFGQGGISAAVVVVEMQVSL